MKRLAATLWRVTSARLSQLDGSDLGLVLVAVGVGGYDWRLGCIAAGGLIVGIPVYLKASARKAQ